MTTAQAIMRHLESMPDSMQREVLDFVEFLESRHKECSAARAADDTWSRFSLESAMRGMEDEESPYTLADIRPDTDTQKPI